MAEALVVSTKGGDQLGCRACDHRAAGTQPNTVLGREDPQNVVLDGRYFQAYSEDGAPVSPENRASRMMFMC